MHNTLGFFAYNSFRMKKTLSIFVAATFVLSSIGISFGTHYCAGKIQENDVHLTHSDLGCGMNNKKHEKSCNNNEASVDKNCCVNTSALYKITDEYESSESDVKLISNFNFVFIVSLFQTILPGNTIITKYRNYRPPKLEKNILVLVQSFLL